MAGAFRDKLTGKVYRPGDPEYAILTGRAPEIAPTAPDIDEPSYLGELYRGVSMGGHQLLGLGAEGLGMLGVLDPQEAEEIRRSRFEQAQAFAPSIRSTKDVEDIDDFVRLMLGYTGQAAPSLGAAVGAGLGAGAGAAALGVGALGTAAAGLGGAGGVSYLLGTGEASAAMEEEGMSFEERQKIAPFVGVAVAGLDVIPIGRAFNKLNPTLKKAAIREGTKQLARAATTRGIALTEMGTEAAQEAIIQSAAKLATGQPVTDISAREVGEEALAGLVPGLVIGRIGRAGRERAVLKAEEERLAREQALGPPPARMMEEDIPPGPPPPPEVMTGVPIGDPGLPPQPTPTAALRPGGVYDLRPPRSPETGLPIDPTRRGFVQPPGGPITTPEDIVGAEVQGLYGAPPPGGLEPPTTIPIRTGDLAPPPRPEVPGDLGAVEIPAQRTGFYGKDRVPVRIVGETPKYFLVESLDPDTKVPRRVEKKNVTLEKEAPSVEEEAGPEPTVPFAEAAAKPPGEIAAPPEDFDPVRDMPEHLRRAPEVKESRFGTPTSPPSKHFPHMTEADVEAFRGMADIQRGEPERAMLRFQHHFHGQIFNVPERAGDILNRMAKDLQWGSTAQEDVLTKIETVLRGIDHPRLLEIIEQESKANADYRKIPLRDYEQKTDRLLKKWGESFDQLPIYNRAQWIAREGARAIGEQNWARAIRLYKDLHRMASSPEWDRLATEVHRGPQGNLVQYDPAQESRYGAGVSQPYPYRSVLKEAVGKLKGDSIPSADLPARLKQLGVKDDEVEWSGLKAAIEKGTIVQGPQGELRVRDLQRFVEEGGARLEERMLPPSPEEIPALEERLRQIRSQEASILRGRDFQETSPEEQGQLRTLARSWGEVNRRIVNLYGGGGVPEWERYTLPGGSNYREFLITLPPEFTRGEFESHAFPDSNILVWVRMKDRDLGGKRTLFVEEIQSDWHQGREPGDYEGPLDPERVQWGALVRERAQTYKESEAKMSRDELLEFLAGLPDLQGEQPTTLYGATVSYLPLDDHTAFLDRLFDRLDQKPHLWEQAKDKTFYVYTHPEGRPVLTDEPQTIQSFIIYIDNNGPTFSDDWRRPGQDVGTFDTRVPDAPYKGDEYIKLALRRMLKLAADEGYDALAWTDGETQVRRNRQGRWVEKAELQRGKEKGIEDAVVYQEEGGTPRTHRLGFETFDTELRSQVGNAAYQRLLKGETIPNLYIGPRGSFYAYDTVAPQYLSKYTKKWGGKVEDVRVPEGDRPWKGKFAFGRALDVGHEYFTGLNFNSREEAAQFQRENPEYASYEIVDVTPAGPSNLPPKAHAHSVSITPRMRESLATEGVEQYRGDQPLRQLPPGTQEALRIESSLRQILSSMGVRKPLSFDLVVKGKDGKPIPGKYQRGGEEIIRVAMNFSDPELTVRHEAVHALWPLLSPQERSVLTTRARRNWRKTYDVDSLYPDLDTEARNEEAVAQAFAEWATKKTPLPGPIRKAFEKFKRFFERVGNFLRKRGFASSQDVFESMARGEVGGRELVGEPTTPVDLESRFDSSPAALRPILQKTIFQEKPIPERVRQTFQNRGWWDNLVRRGVRGSLDKFIDLKELEWSRKGIGKLPDAMASAYKAFRATNDTYSVMIGVLRGGPLQKFSRQTPDGHGSWWKVDDTWDKGGVLDIVKPLEDLGALDTFWLWRIVKRGKRLSQETITVRDPETGKKTTRSREVLLDETAKELGFDSVEALSNHVESVVQSSPHFELMKQTEETLNEFNHRMLEFARDMGLLDQTTMDLFEKYQDWIPFYRVYDNELRGPSQGLTSVVGQTLGIRKLKGGPSPINNPLENLVLSYQSLVDRAVKNFASQKAVSLGLETNALHEVTAREKGRFRTDSKSVRQLASAINQALDPQNVNPGPVIPTDELTKNDFKLAKEFSYLVAPPEAPNIIRVMYDGKPRYFEVTSPDLMYAFEGLTPIQMTGLHRILQGFAHLLRVGVTSSPAFMAANFMRDSVQASVLTGTNPWKAPLEATRALRNKDEMVRRFAMGQTSIGYYKIASEVATLNKMSSKPHLLGPVVNSAQHLWDIWNLIGGSLEQANRRLIFDQALEQGATEPEAAFRARDYMDFSLSGRNALIRNITMAVPFLNARLQGLYKVGREQIPNAEINRINQDMLTRGLILAGLTLALQDLIDKDEYWSERYEALDDWVKDAYYMIPVPDEAKEFLPNGFLFPKAFELGAFYSTIPERVLRSAEGSDSPDKTWESALRMLLDTFAFNPIPQAVQPLLETMANFDTFTGRPIVPRHLEDKPPELQRKAYTSLAIEELIDHIPKDVEALPGGETIRSPAKLEHLIRGYLGSLGTYFLTAANQATYASNPELYGSPVDEGTRSLPIVGHIIRRFAPKEPLRTSRWVGDFYDLHREIAGTAAILKKAQEDGEVEALAQILRDHRADLVLEEGVKAARRKMADLNRRIREIERNRALSGEEKSNHLDDLRRKREQLARHWVRLAAKERRRIDSELKGE